MGFSTLILAETVYDLIIHEQLSQIIVLYTKDIYIHVVICKTCICLCQMCSQILRY